MSNSNKTTNATEHIHVVDDGSVISHSHDEHICNDTLNHNNGHNGEHTHSDMLSHNAEHSHDNMLNCDDEHAHDNMHNHDEHICDNTHNHNDEHTHDDSHNHNGEHTHNGSHPHHHENTKAVLNRMSRAIGHMESIKTMIENGRDCTEVLVQIAAVRSAINNVGKIILEDHINHCIVDAVETGDEQALKDLNDAIEKFVK